MKTTTLDSSTKTILIVEDELTISLALSRKLNSFGYNTITAISGEEAIEIIDSEISVDLIIMDIDLGPGIDGTVAAQRILKTRSLPIVFHSSHTEKEYIDKIRGITRYGFITKNSEDYIIKSSVEMALDLCCAYKNIQEREESLNITFQSIGDAVISTNLSGQIVRMNPKAECMTGWSLEDAIGRDFSDVFQICNSITRAPVENPFQKVIKTGEVVGLANHTILIRKDKKEFHIADSAAPIKDSKGDIQGIIIVFSDISENYQYQEEIRKSEERYRDLVNNLTSGITVHNPDSTLIYSNPKACEILGLTNDQLLGKTIVDPFWAFLNEDGSVMALEDYPINRLFALKAPLQNYLVGLRIPNKPNPIWGLCNGYLVYDDDGNITQGVITFHEVTARIEAENKMKTSSRWYEHLVESINGIIWEADPVTRNFTFVSQHAEKTLGYSIEEWKEPLFWEKHIFEEDREEVIRKCNERITTLDNHDIEYRFYSKDKKVVWVRDIIRVNSRNGVPVSLNGILIDINTRKINELEVAQLLKEKEVLLKEIHHRVKNNMSTISGLLSLQANTLDNPEVQNILKYSRLR
jgi:PAS domain S-box-containing protein